MPVTIILAFASIDRLGQDHASIHCSEVVPYGQIGTTRLIIDLELGAVNSLVPKESSVEPVNPDHWRFWVHVSSIKKFL